MAYSPDGSRIVSGGGYGDETVRVWDAATGQEVSQLLGHTEAVNAVAFSPDGEWIVSGSGDETVRVWDAKTGQEVSQLLGHTEAVNSVAFSPDGERIVSSSGNPLGLSDKTVRVWFGDINYLLDLADSLIQRDPPRFSRRRVRQIRL